MSFKTNWLNTLLLVSVLFQHGLSQLSNSQMVIYWGQDSVGDFSNVPSQQEKPLRNYCSDSTYDIIVIGFVYLFPTASGSTLPGMNFAGHCEDPFSNSNPYLLNCASTIGPDIQYCQSQGKKIFISLGGGVGQYGFSSDTQGTTFATTIWDMFLGGSSSSIPRPFGNVILDGIDLDIEGGTTTGYIPFINTLRNYYASSSKQYYISAAPQCFYPDRMGPGTGTPLTSAWFDFIWIQFYNNGCGLDHYPSAFNFDTWAGSKYLNPNTKLFIGAPAATQAAGSGYVSLSTLETIANVFSAKYPNMYGGIMLWDASTSDYNNNFGGSVSSYVHKNAKASSGSTSSSSTTTTTTTTTTSGKATTGKPATTGVKSVTTGVVKSSTSSSTSSKSTSTSTSTSSSNNQNSCACTYGSMQCNGAGTYQTCGLAVDGSTYWEQTQSCQAGLACHQTGSYIYCY